MNRLRLTIAGLFLSIFASLATSQEVPILPSADSVPEIRRPASFDTSKVRPLGTLRSRSTSTASSMARTRAGAPSSLGVLDIEIAQLPYEVHSGPHGERLAIRTTPLPTGDPPGSGPLTLSFDGKQFSLAVVHQTSDLELGTRHFTMQVLNQPNSYARLSVAGTDRITGTIVTPTATYRLLPAGPGAVSVHRLTASGKASPQLQGIADPGSGLDSELERRHVQLEQLAQVQPQRAFAVNAGRFLSIEGGALGKLNRPVTAEKVLAVVKSFAAANHAPPDLHIAMAQVRAAGSEHIVGFRQTVNGIAVRGEHEIRLDVQGNITSITTQFVDPAWAESRPILEEGEAQQAAVSEIEEAHKEPVPIIELLEPTDLRYEIEEGHKLTPYYTFTISLPEGEAYVVQVDAHTGRAQLAINPSVRN